MAIPEPGIFALTTIGSFDVSTLKTLSKGSPDKSKGFMRDTQNDFENSLP